MTGTLLTFVCCRFFFGFTIKNLYLHLVYLLLLYLYKLAALQCGTMNHCVQDYFVTLERLRLTTSTANVYGKATRTRTRNRIRFLVKIVWATCRPYGVL